MPYYTMDALLNEIEDQYQAKIRYGWQLKTILNKIYDYYMQYDISIITCAQYGFPEECYTKDSRPYGRVYVYIGDFIYTFYSDYGPDKKVAVSVNERMKCRLSRVPALIDEIAALKGENERLKHEIEKAYAPDGQGYVRAKQDFEAHIKK